MNKTIYLRDEDGPIWDRARELAGEKLSPVIVEGLRRFIAGKEAEEAEKKGFYRIEIEFNDADHHEIPKRTAFFGKWIYHPQVPFTLRDMEDGTYEHFAVALTAKGNVAIYYWREDESDTWGYRFRVFPSLEKAASYPEFNSVARKAIETRGVPVEELDI